jgi:hypothetical protein
MRVVLANQPALILPRLDWFPCQPRHSRRVGQSRMPGWLTGWPQLTASQALLSANVQRVLQADAQSSDPKLGREATQIFERFQQTSPQH